MPADLGGGVSQRIVIIGAGPGGMATAMRLAATGYQVAIYEAADRVGIVTDSSPLFYS